ncbi:MULTISPECIES: hypothetical protein [Methylomonas]|nr:MULTISPECIES: hypothetical protein [Methylomonas]
MSRMVSLEIVMSGVSRGDERMMDYHLANFLDKPIQGMRADKVIVLFRTQAAIKPFGGFIFGFCRLLVPQRLPL